MRSVALAASLLLAGCAPAGEASKAPLATSAWQEFEGTWTAAGSRQTMGLGDQRRVSTATLEGTLLLGGAARPGVGFRARAIVFNDSASGMVGRATWTDERGDQLFSELRGQGTATGDRIEGRFVGGTGRYAGATGDYAFGWRFVLESEDGNVHGQSQGLEGRIRAAGSGDAPASAGAPP